MLFYYRAIFQAEYDDWKASGRLRSSPTGMEGKHFTDTVPLAQAFGRMFRAVGWERGPFWVIAAKFDDAAAVPLHEEKQDGVGPSYFANEAALQLVLSVTEVCQVKEDE